MATGTIVHFHPFHILASFAVTKILKLYFPNFLAAGDVWTKLGSERHLRGYEGGSELRIFSFRYDRWHKIGRLESSLKSANPYSTFQCQVFSASRKWCCSGGYSSINSWPQHLSLCGMTLKQWSYLHFNGKWLNLLVWNAYNGYD